jgi:hypothetical protein
MGQAIPHHSGTDMGLAPIRASTNLGTDGILSSPCMTSSLGTRGNMVGRRSGAARGLSVWASTGARQKQGDTFRFDIAYFIAGLFTFYSS